jgi:hypothetical protein
MRFEITKEEIDSALNDLRQVRENKSLWTVSNRPGGQDQYVGLPPAMRHIDGAISILQWVIDKQMKFKSPGIKR